jgi:hypothetical protein
MEEPALILSQLKSGELVERIALAYNAPLKAMNIHKFLISVDISPRQVASLESFFTKVEFVGDPEDRITIADISQSQLIRRLTNSCLYQLWQVNQETDLADYLVKYKEQASRPEEDVKDVQPALMELELVGLERLLECADDYKPRITAAAERGYVEALKTLAALLKCQVSEASQNEFIELTEADEAASHIQADATTYSKTAQSLPCYTTFISLLSSWKHKLEASVLPPVLSESETPQPITIGQISLQIEETLRAYEDLRQQQLGRGEDTTAVDSIIQNCRLQLAHLARSPTTDLQSQKHERWLAKCRQSLSEIFEFYAKQALMVGRTPSFAEIEQANQSWTLSKFLKFLTDFGLSHAHSSKRSLSRSEGSDIFMKHAYLRRSLSEAGFTQALESVAEAYFNAEYDRLTSSEVSLLSLQQKLVKLYEVLEIDSVAKYTKRMKGYSLPFSSDTRSRIAPDDPAIRYKFQVSDRVLKNLENWRRSKANISSRSPVPKMQSQVRRPTDERSGNIARPYYGRSSELRADLQGVTIDTTKLQEKNAITWKKLGDMSFGQLKDPGDQFDIRTLIVDSDSDEESMLKLPVLKHRPRAQFSPAMRSQLGEKSMYVGNSYYMRSRQKQKTFV